jgi:hypothetical protein
MLGDDDLHTVLLLRLTRRNRHDGLLFLLLLRHVSLLSVPRKIAGVLVWVKQLFTV